MRQPRSVIADISDQDVLEPTNPV